MPRKRNQEITCEMCGEPLPAFSICCPFCEHRQSSQQLKLKRQKHFVFNLEEGLPDSQTALERMNEAIADAQHEGALSLKIIHGYGSSGRGGVLRQYLQSALDIMLHHQLIEDYIPGEKFSTKNCRNLLQTHPYLRKERDLDKNNEGVCIIIL